MRYVLAHKGVDRMTHGKIATILYYAANKLVTNDLR